MFFRFQHSKTWDLIRLEASFMEVYARFYRQVDMVDHENLSLNPLA